MADEIDLFGTGGGKYLVDEAADLTSRLGDVARTPDGGARIEQERDATVVGGEDAVPLALQLWCECLPRRRIHLGSVYENDRARMGRTGYAAEVVGTLEYGVADTEVPVGEGAAVAVPAPVKHRAPATAAATAVGSTRESVFDMASISCEGVGRAAGFGRPVLSTVTSVIHPLQSRGSRLQAGWVGEPVGVSDVTS